MDNGKLKDNTGNAAPWRKKEKPQTTDIKCFGCGRPLKDFELFMDNYHPITKENSCAFCLIALKTGRLNEKKKP